MDTRTLGSAGEKLAEQFLRKQGYKILERNYRKKFGEIDIIARHRRAVVFVEVKTRSSVDFGLPEESVKPDKLRRIEKAAEFYLISHRIKAPVRYEVLSVLADGPSWKFSIIPVC
jgi:putative endonuclease